MSAGHNEDNQTNPWVKWADVRAFIAAWHCNNNKKKNSISQQVCDIKAEKWFVCRWLRAILKKLVSASTSVVSVCPSYGLNLTAAFIKVTRRHKITLKQMETHQPRLSANMNRTLAPTCAFQDHLLPRLSGLEKARKVPAMKWASRSVLGSLTIASCAPAKAICAWLALLFTLFFSRLVSFRVTPFQSGFERLFAHELHHKPFTTDLSFAHLMCTARSGFTLIRIKSHFDPAAIFAVNFNFMRHFLIHRDGKI